MVILHALLMTMTVSGGVVLGMEIEFGYWEKERCAIVKETGMPEVGIEVIKALAKNDFMLIRVLNNKKGAEQVLDFVGEKCLNFWREPGIGCRDRQGFRKELAAAVLGTSGAIAFGKEYIQGNDEAKQRLQEFLSDIVQYGHEPNHKSDGFTFANEGVDIMQAGLEILNDSQVQNNLIVHAAHRNKVKTVELFLARKANINAIDDQGRTSLIRATQRGCVEVVKKLLAVEAAVWLLDGFDKSALDYAQEGLSKASEQDKEKYEKIIELLEHAK